MKKENVSTMNLLPLGRFHKCAPNETLGSVLAKTRDSHDTAFVFGNREFLGVISPYLALFRRRYPYLTKISHCILKPPRVTDKTSVYDLAEFMLSTKIYALPVVNEHEKIKGIATSSNLLKKIVEIPSLFKKTSQIIEIHKPITADIGSSAKDIYNLIREKKVARIILTNSQKKLAGIISRRDIEDALIARTVRQRFITKKGPQRHFSFDEEEIDRLDSPIAEFAIKRVATASSSLGTQAIVEKMVQSKRHSIVVVKNGYPVGFLSRHDILKAVSSLKPRAEIPITFQDLNGNISKVNEQYIYDTVNNFAKKLHERLPIRRVEISIRQSKNAAGFNKRLFTTKLHFQLKSGKLFIASAEATRLSLVMKDLANKIRHETHLSDRQKHELTA